MLTRAMIEQRKDTALHIRRERDRLRKARQRAEAKRSCLHMSLKQIIVSCLLVQVCRDAGATAGLWILHTKTKTRKGRQLMQAWGQDELQLLAQLLHDESRGKEVALSSKPDIRAVPPSSIRLSSRILFA